MKKFEIMEKFYSSKPLLKIAGGGDAFPTSPPGSALLSRKNFEILHGVMAFLVLFEQILITLFAPYSESFTKYDAFCSLIFNL